MGTLSANKIATTYKSLVFTDHTSSGVGDIYYTSTGDADVKLTTLTTALTFTGKITAKAGIELDNNIIYASDGGTTITLDTSDNVAITGDLIVTGNDIKTGNIGSSTTAITMSGANVAIAGDLTITGGNITNAITCDSTVTTTGLLTANANVVIGPDSDADRSIVFGHATLKTIMGIDDDQDVFAINTDAAFEAANDFELDASGNATIKGDLTISGGNITNALTLDSTLTVSSNTTIAGNLTFTGARDILFTEGDGLEIRDADSVYMAMINNAITVTPATTFNGKILCIGNTGPTAGTGITEASSETYKSWVERYGTMIKTSILIDVTSLRHSASGDIIGNNGTSNPCHIGQITDALNGTIISGRMTCLEVPDDGAACEDMDLYQASAGTGSEDSAISGVTGYAQLINSGDWAAGGQIIMTDANLPVNNDYLYLVCGEGGDADYTAGKFLIELWGTV